MPDAAEYIAFLSAVYSAMPTDAGATIREVGARLRRDKLRTRTALERLAARGLIEAMEERHGNVFRWRYQIKGPRLTATEVIERLSAGRGKRRRKGPGRKYIPNPGPQVVMQVSGWRTDRHGNLTRTLKGVAIERTQQQCTSVA